MFTFFSFPDEEKPTILSCPSDITHSVTSGHTSVDVEWSSPDAWDNCRVVSFKPDKEMTEGTFSIGSHDMVYEVTDCSGNKNYCNFTIFIRGRWVKKYAETRQLLFSWKPTLFNRFLSGARFSKIFESLNSPES